MHVMFGDAERSPDDYVAHRFCCIRRGHVLGIDALRNNNKKKGSCLPF